MEDKNKKIKNSSKKVQVNKNNHKKEQMQMTKGVVKDCEVEKNEAKHKNNDDKIVEKQYKNDSNVNEGKEFTELNKLQQENTNLKDKYIRAEAEIQNLNRRFKLDLEKAYKFNSEGLMKSMLTVLDSFNKGLQVARKALVDIEDNTVKNFIGGQELTHKLLLDSLEKAGLSKINTLNSKFDPNYHEAMSMIHDPNYESGVIIDELEVGYVLYDRLLRPAKVIVAK